MLGIRSRSGYMTTSTSGTGISWKPDENRIAEAKELLSSDW
jgi:hypothetical protein